MAAFGLVGREAEVAQLEKALAEAVERGGAIAIAGGAGIGKTSLLGAAANIARARGYKVLSVTGLESETDLPYAGLHQLLQPVMSTAGSLPGPQKSALLTALGMRAGPPPEVFLVGLATLNLLVELADESPLLLLADDFQWLDGPTSAVLSFVSRRLESTHILLIFGGRTSLTPSMQSGGLPAIHLEPLDDDASSELLASVAKDLDAQTRRLVLDEALGNPLGLMELPRAYRLQGADEHEGTLRSIPLTDRLERTFSYQAAQLPKRTRLALLLVALDKDPTIGDVLAGASRQLGGDVGLEILQPALDAGLVVVSGSMVRYRHPLIRSAVDQSATAAERRNAHLALAEAVADPDRRAWHRAKSVLGEDERAAADLEAVAARARDRGATATALGALEFAASLTPPGQRRARRLMAAAEMAFQLGDAPAVGRLLDSAAKLELTANDVARMTWLREIFRDGAPGDPNAVARLVAAAADVGREGDVALALNLLQGAALRCWWADPGASAKSLVADALGQVTADELDPRALEILSLVAPIDAGAQISARIRRAVAVEGADPARIQLLAFAAYAVGDIALSIELMDGAAPLLRAQGRLGLLAQLLAVRAWAGINTGQFAGALQFADEGCLLAVETSQPIWTAIARMARAIVSGLRGDEALAEQGIAEAEESLAALRLSIILAQAAYARGMTAMSAGRNSDAFDHFARMFDPGGPAYHALVAHGAAPYVIEAGVRAGRTEDALRMMVELEALAERTPAALVQIGLRHARALLADDSNAESLYREALRAEPKWQFDHARLEMSYGTWLRRQRRITESRPHLRAARDAFVALGVQPWANKARAELRASGDRVSKAARPSREVLSSQELQIAQLAASGLSNREIADRLFLSHRTVGSHLYRVFPKLGVASRSDLAEALASMEPALTG